MPGPETQISPTTSLSHGQRAVGVAEVRILGTTEQLTRSVSVKALSTNTGIVYIGRQGVTTATGWELSAGESIDIDVNEQAVNLYAIASMAAQGVCWIAIA